MPVTVKVQGLEELEKKLDGKLLVQPEIGPVLDTVAARGMRGGKGLGVQRNTLGLQSAELSRTLGTTLNFPRTKGTTWRDKNIRNFLPPVVRNAVQKAARNIAARFAA